MLRVVTGNETLCVKNNTAISAERDGCVPTRSVGTSAKNAPELTKYIPKAEGEVDKTKKGYGKDGTPTQTEK